MRLLFVNDKGGYFGGVEQNVADCAAGLRSLGHECFLAYGTQEGARDGEQFDSIFNEMHSCSCLAECGDAPFTEILDRVNPDVVYLHNVAKVKPLHSVMRDGGVRSIRMIHDHTLCCPTGYKYFRHSGRICHHKAGWRCWMDLGFLEKNPDSALRVRWSGIQGKIAEMKANFELDGLVVGSEFMRQELLTNGCDPARVHLLPPVVKLSLGRPPEPIGEEPLILFVGQLIRGKGVDLLLDALVQVKAPFKARIVGAGNAEEGLKQKAEELGLRDSVDFLGWTPNSALGAQYDEARVVVVPSRWPEPFGMVGLEAMMHGRPVVAFEVGGIVDWLEDGVTGLLAPEQDIASFAAGLDRFLTEEGLAARMGQAGHERVRTVFDFDSYVQNLAATLAG